MIRSCFGCGDAFGIFGAVLLGGMSFGMTGSTPNEPSLLGIAFGRIASTMVVFFGLRLQFCGYIYAADGVIDATRFFYYFWFFRFEIWLEGGMALFARAFTRALVPTTKKFVSCSLPINQLAYTAKRGFCKPADPYISGFELPDPKAPSSRKVTHITDTKHTWWSVWYMCKQTQTNRGEAHPAIYGRFKIKSTPSWFKTGLVKHLSSAQQKAAKQESKIEKQP